MANAALDPQIDVSPPKFRFAPMPQARNLGLGCGTQVGIAATGDGLCPGHGVNTEASVFTGPGIRRLETSLVAEEQTQSA